MNDEYFDVGRTYAVVLDNGFYRGRLAKVTKNELILNYVEVWGVLEEKVGSHFSSTSYGWRNKFINPASDYLFIGRGFVKTAYISNSDL